MEVNYDKCWFCNKSINNMNSGHLSVPLYYVTGTEDFSNADVGQVKTKHYYKTINMMVPRCQNCKNASDSQFEYKRIGGYIGAATGLIASIIYQVFYGETTGDSSGFDLGPYIIGVVLGAFLGTGIGVVIGIIRSHFILKVKIFHDLNDYPPLSEMLDQGWSIGDRPGEWG